MSGPTPAVYQDRSHNGIHFSDDIIDRGEWMHMWGKCISMM